MYKIIFLCLCTLSCLASLEEKVGQLLMVHFQGEKVNEDARMLIQDLHVGSIIYYNFANGLHSPDQVRALSSELQELASIPLLIAIDQEGGKVSRLRTGFTPLPSPQNLSPQSAQHYAYIAGQELADCGIHLNLAPVVDISSNSRSFGETSDIVIACGKAALQGYHHAGIAATLKHFPGHGAAKEDSHETLPVSYKSYTETYEEDLMPFRALAHTADAIMTAHILVPSLDPHVPATLSKPILNILRKDIGFEGVIISDSLNMEGILHDSDSIEEIAIRAFNAGCDILCLGGKQLIGENTGREFTPSDIKKIHTALVQAVQKGQVSEEKLEASLSRILTLKNRMHPCLKKIPT